MIVKIPTEIYTRCVGYFRPISQFNPGKKAEVDERKMLLIPEDSKEKTHGTTARK